MKFEGKVTYKRSARQPGRSNNQKQQFLSPSRDYDGLCNF